MKKETPLAESLEEGNLISSLSSKLHDKGKLIPDECFNQLILERGDKCCRMLFVVFLMAPRTSFSCMLFSLFFILLYFKKNLLYLKIKTNLSIPTEWKFSCFASSKHCFIHFVMVFFPPSNFHFTSSTFQFVWWTKKEVIPVAQIQLPSGFPIQWKVVRQKHIFYIFFSP